MTRYMLAGYLNSLVGRLFKILPLWEAGAEGCQPYLDSLCREMNGFTELADEIGHDGRYTSLLSILTWMKGNSCAEASVIRGEVFHAIDLVKCLLRDHCGGEVKDG